MNYYCCPKLTEKEFYKVIDTFPDNDRKRFTDWMERYNQEGNCKGINFHFKYGLLECEWNLRKNVIYCSNLNELIKRLKVERIRNKLAK